MKERFSYPVTKITGIKERERSPRASLQHKHEFETPLSETIEVTNYPAADTDTSLVHVVNIQGTK